MKGTLKVGHIDYELSTSWVKIGPIAGFLGIAAYFAAATNLLPSRVTLILAFAMGLLLSAAFIGFYHFIRPIGIPSPCRQRRLSASSPVPL